MPHRTVFQWGKNHAHPFTMFIGGVVIGTLVTGAIAWAWTLAEDSDLELQNNVIKGDTTATGSPAPRVSPTVSPTVTF